MKKGFTLIILSMILFPASLWALAWFFSAYKKAEEYCMGEFSIFHEQAFCREPMIALYIAGVIALLSAYILAKGGRHIRNASKTN